jgi:hypothetical protein
MKIEKPLRLYVLLDTNVYYPDMHRVGPQFKTLHQMLAKSNSILLIPDIIGREVIKKFSENVKKDFAELEKILNRYPDSIKKLQSATDIIKDFTNKWNDHNHLNSDIVVISHESVSIEKLVNRSILEQAPFGKKTKGFRDAVIWETALNYLENKKDNYAIALITNNSRDFGFSELNTDLENEVKKIGREIYYYSNIGGFLEEHGKKIEFINDDFIDKFIEDNISTLEGMAEDFSKFEDYIDTRDLDLEHKSPEDIKVLSSSMIDWDIYSYYIYDEDNNWYYVHIQVEIEVDLEIEYSYVSKDGYWSDTIIDVRSTSNEYKTICELIDLELQVGKYTKEAQLL